MDRHRGDRGGDRPSDRFGEGGRRMPSRWSSSDSPPHQHQRYPRGGSGGGEGFSGGGRYHPYRGPQDFPPPPPPGGGGGFRSGGPVGFSPPVPMGDGPRRGFSGRGGSPDHVHRSRFAKLFIGAVPRTATEEDIRPLFEEHGDVIEVAFIKDRQTGEQQGCCFVKYATSEEAERAIRALHNQITLPGGFGPIQVRYADRDREHHGAVEDKLFVASLNKQATKEEIKAVFSPYGDVDDVYIMRDSEKLSRGCGFVKFKCKEDAITALNALNGKYVMRGCDQPLIVRFAEPKRPRPGEPRGGPTFGGPGFSPRSEAALVIRPTVNLDEQRNGRNAPDSWHPLSPAPFGPSSHFSNHGSGSQLAAKGGSVATSSDTSAIFANSGGPTNGSISGVSVPPSSQQGFNFPIPTVHPISGQQISPLQKPLMPPQSFPLKLQPNKQPSGSSSQTLNSQASMQQLGQFQISQSGGLASFNSALASQQLTGLGGQTSASLPLFQHNGSSASLQTPLSLQILGIPTIANQQQFPVSNITPQVLQQPLQQFSSQPPQLLLQKQTQDLQSSCQSSQQALIQLHQQLQLIQQPQGPQAAKQQSAWTGPPSGSNTPASSAASAPATTMPSTVSVTSALSGNISPKVSFTCNWTEHTSPEGFKYYYNSVTLESKWEKPEEYNLFEKQQPQQKVLLLQQPQQKLAVQMLASPSDTQSHAQIQHNQQVSQSQQVQSQIMRQQSQLQLLQPLQVEFNYPQIQVAGSVIDPSRVQQGIQVSQERTWKNKNAGSEKFPT